MSQYGDDLIFDGVNGLSGGTFVRNIRQQVLSRGIQDDDRLIALTAASFFDGDALDWYETLDEETQESWKLLRRALLGRWSATLLSSTTPNVAAPAPAPVSARTVAPTPAAAPNPGSSLPPTQSPISSSKPGKGILPRSPLSGRIRVHLFGNTTPFGYVSRSPDKDGDLNTTVQLSEALVVRMTSSQDPHGLKIQSSGLPNDWLGFVLHSSNAEQELATELMGGTLISMRLASDRDAYAGILSAVSSHEGPRRATVWNVLVDGCIQVTWKASQAVFHRFWPFLITNRQSSDYGGIMFFSGYDSRLPGHSAVRERSLEYAELVFEPI